VATALASPADVKRQLRIADDDTSQDAAISAALAAVNSWASQLKWKFAAEGPQMETYFDVNEDATLWLPAPDSVVTKVKVYEYPSSYGIPLSPIELGLGHGFDLTDDGALILRPVLQISPFEGATAQRRLRAYSRVEVHYIGTGVVPKAVSEGIAILAAGFYTDGPRALKGLKSERIGDYSYTVGSGSAQDEMPEYQARAMWLLKPFLHRMRVRVI